MNELPTPLAKAESTDSNCVIVLLVLPFLFFRPVQFQIFNCDVWIWCLHRLINWNMNILFCYDFVAGHRIFVCNVRLEIRIEFNFDDDHSSFEFAGKINSINFEMNQPTPLSFGFPRTDPVAMKLCSMKKIILKRWMSIEHQVV